MVEVCTTCGLPKDLCVCGEIEKEQQRIRVRLETRKFGRLKAYCACGGTHKAGQIMLQGDHRDRVRDFLIKIGYPAENIERQ